MNGAQIMLEMLASAGVRYVFGNPGSTELPLTDAMVTDNRLEYILGLQEIPVMGIAEGYAQATRQPGVVNLHISPGLGNGLGMLYNAHRSGTPLIVTAGQQDRRLRFSEPILWGEMVDVARPWTKWSAEVQRVEDIPAAMRRAIQTALMPPTGPVFLSIPVDVQQQEAPPLDLTPPQPIHAGIRPPRDELIRAADILATATNPDILAEVVAAPGERVVVGFAAESEDVIPAAQRKLARKGCDLIVANDVSRTDAGFDVETNAVSFVWPGGEVEELPLLPKDEVAAQLLDRVEKLLRGRECG